MSVNVPVRVPSELTTPFTKRNPVVVSVPANVPTPGMTCMIAVVNDPPAGAAVAGVTITNGKANKVSAMNSARNVRRVFITSYSA